MVSPDEARTSVRTFLAAVEKDAGFAPERIDSLLGTGRPDESPNVGPMWTFRSPLGTFWVSQRTGEVLFYTAPSADRERAARAAAVSPDDAATVAGTFIRAVYKGFERRNFKLVSSDADDETIEFEYSEVARPPEVSIFENFVSVTVSTDRGQVTRYGASNLPFKRMTPPRIPEQEARRIIGAMVAPDKGAIEELRLTEHPVDGASRSITVWSASVVYRPDGDMFARRVAINADTGEQVQLK